MGEGDRRRGPGLRPGYFSPYRGRQGKGQDPLQGRQGLVEGLREGDESLLYPLIMAEILAPPLALRGRGVCSPARRGAAGSDSDGVEGAGD